MIHSTNIQKGNHFNYYRTGSHFYETEYEIWADLRPVGNTEKKIWADYEQLLRAVFLCFHGQ